jgi:hypothetical protein
MTTTAAQNRQRPRRQNGAGDQLPRARVTMPPRGLPQRGAKPRDEGAYRLAGSLKRERERERCDSAKLAHLGLLSPRGAKTLDTSIPLKLTRKPTPSSILTRSLSLANQPCQLLL